MSWAYGKDDSGREIGYSVPDVCNEVSCDRKIDRGLGYRCGGVTNLHTGFGCGNFFCGNHLHLWCPDQLCPKCYAEFEKENPNYGEPTPSKEE